tara:strand:+ start:6088 stop:6471 length:384 start_codon:yes stop_codon:yes gene_type:complete
MINKREYPSSIVIDLDQTICFSESGDYINALPNNEVIAKLREMKNLGFSIVIYTARNMRTFAGNLGKINVHTLPTIIKWLDKYNVPYDEIMVGKPWPGPQGFYVDDKAIRPNEFINLSLQDINKLIC